MGPGYSAGDWNIVLVASETSDGLWGIVTSAVADLPTQRGCNNPVSEPKK
jgi:hypothetical protein